MATTPTSICPSLLTRRTSSHGHLSSESRRHRDRHYHTPEDTPEKLDYPKMLALADALTDLVISASRQPTLNYDKTATDDAATLETLRFLGYHQPAPTANNQRALSVLARLEDKQSSGNRMTTDDYVIMTRLLERFEKGLA